MTDLLFDEGYALVSKMEALDPRLAAQEREFIDKASVCWRDRGMGTLFVNDQSALSCSNPSQARALIPYMRKRASEYIKHLLDMDRLEVRQLYLKGAVMLNKGKGAPYWQPGSDRDAALALAKLVSGSRSLAELYERIATPGAARMGLVQTSYIRIQGARKVVQDYGLVDGRITPIGERMKAKIRRIGAQPFATNHLWAGVGNVLRTLMATMDDRTTGTIDPAATAASAAKHTVAFDLSSYDTTVSLETLSAVREYMLEPILSVLVALDVLSATTAKLLLELDVYAQQAQILLPPRHKSEVAWLADASGQIRSGENLTSWKGSEINRMRCRLKARELGLGAHKAFNYGDDTIVTFEHEADAQKWADAREMSGFVETVAPDTTFLMRRLPAGHTYLMRMLFACVNREVSGEPLTVLAAAAAMRTRYELLNGHPLQESFFRMLDKWRRSERWSRAVTAAKTTSALRLTMAASKEQHALNPARNKDDMLHGLEKLADGPNLTSAEKAGAVAAMQAIIGGDIDDRSQITVGALEDTINEITFANAESIIRERSYVIADARRIAAS
jgi:hypothetical protein